MRAGVIPSLPGPADEFAAGCAIRGDRIVPGLKAKKFAGGFGKQSRFLFGGKFHHFNELARFRFAKRERIIGAKCNALRAEKLNQHLQGVCVVNE